MPYTVNRLDNGEPLSEQHGDAIDQRAKTWDTPEAAQKYADVQNSITKTWEVKEARNFVVLIGLTSKTCTCRAEVARLLANLVVKAKAGKFVPGLMLPRGEES